uniref:Uncharacterized protein LOC114348932 n=1 Tax=Diabrotica virgifera virgifera TaxID=50390 RepID=A0A6P7GZL0_DIAVI
MLLEEDILPALAEVVREDHEVWFQMDGCPAHNSQTVKEFLNNCFNDCIIGPNCQIKRPPRSGDLAPNDFFLWGHLKTRIYSEKKLNSLEELKNSIREECRKTSPRILANVRREFYNRLGYCLVQNGGIFEHLL